MYFGRSTSIQYIHLTLIMLYKNGGDSVDHLYLEYICYAVDHMVLGVIKSSVHFPVLCQKWMVHGFIVYPSTSGSHTMPRSHSTYLSPNSRRPCIPRTISDILPNSLLYRKPLEGSPQCPSAPSRVDVIGRGTSLCVMTFRPTSQLGIESLASK